MNSKERLEEKLNTYSHGLGMVLAIVGSFYLFQSDLSSRIFLGLWVYVVSLVLLFGASTMYHAALSPTIRAKLRVLDHISIYYLIAGTYTPVCLTLLNSSKGNILLWLVWGIAIFGTFLKLFFTGKYELFSLSLYAVMGWLVIIDMTALLELATSFQLSALTIGGVFYTVGIVFYAVRKIPYNHFIWHLFVLGGAISHWFMIYALA